MRTKGRSTPAHSRAPGVLIGPVGNGSVASRDVTEPAAATDVPLEVPPSADRTAATASAPGRAAGSAASERDERRHQRAVARQQNGRGHHEKIRERLQPGVRQPPGPSERTRLALGKTVSLGLIAIIGAGLIVGAILGALSAPGWVIGLLVATSTAILSAALHRSPRFR